MSDRPWLKAYGDSPATIDADRYPSVTALMEQAMQRYAERVAFRSLGRTLSYREVDRLSAAFCAFLQQRLGVRKGDRIAVMLPNLAAFRQVQFVDALPKSTVGKILRRELRAA
ncbi:MAG: AMP-binding protein [Proteobacteria bacterium]|nr:AMP-binding protein [Pseudomonadota bacterium]